MRAKFKRESPSRSPSPQPPPQPQVVKGPTIEREVITHYTDIDHGESIVNTLEPWVLETSSEAPLSTNTDRRGCTGPRTQPSTSAPAAV